MVESSLVHERSPYPNSPLEVELLQVFNPEDPYTMSASLGEPFVPRILYGGSSSGALHNDPRRHSWAPRGNPQTDAGISCALIDSGYALGYVNYFFGGSNSGSPDDQ